MRIQTWGRTPSRRKTAPQPATQQAPYKQQSKDKTTKPNLRLIS